MRKFLILAASAAILAAPAVALAQRAPPPADATARGARHLDPAEREARRHAAFDRLDADHNGTLTFAEFSASHRRVRASDAAPPGERPFRSRGIGARRGSALDADGDGTVTREEYMAAMQARFERLDADHDGRLSLDERHAHGRRAAPPAGN